LPPPLLIPYPRPFLRRCRSWYCLRPK
jgi:hypothetical protein